MARISFSPLIVEASGKVKDTVFSRWKGRPYIRSRVTPANPNTASQQAVRNSLARCVALWQSVTADMKTNWNTYASPYSISGYNAFVQANRADEQAGNVLQVTAQDSVLEGLDTLTAASGGASGEIDLTWTGGTTGADKYAYILTRKDGEDSLTLEESTTTLVSAGARTISGLSAGDDYQVYVAVYDDTEGTLSISKGDTATALA